MVKDRSEAMLLRMADLGLGKEAVAVLLEISGDYHRDHIRFMKGPVVVHRGPWGDTIPKWLFDGIAGDRLRIIFQEREEGVVGHHVGPVELSAVMYPAMLESPTSSEVSDLYLWATTKACARRDDKPEAVYWENLGGDPVEDRHVLQPNGRSHHAYRELAHAIRSKVLKHQMERERAEKRTKKPAAPAEPIVAEELPLFALAKVPAYILLVMQQLGPAKTGPLRCTTAPTAKGVLAMAKKPNEIRLPVNILLAATLCSGQDDTRSYLAGVYLKAHDKELRCVSTDGHRMLVISRELPKDVPDWLKDGVIVSNASLKERLALMARVGYDLSTSFEDRMVVVSETGGNLTLKDPRGDCVFRVQIVDGTFPDYEAVMASISDSIFTGGLATPNGDDDAVTVQMVGGPVPIGFRSQYIKSIAEVARLLGSEHVALRTSTAENGAMVTFPEADGAVLYVMPAKVPTALAKGNSNILSLPLRRSLAALKAHATRNKGWAKEAKEPAEKAEFKQKAEDFEGRIVTLIEQAPELKALPAPKPKKAANGAGKAKSGKDKSKAKRPAKGKAKKTAKPTPKTSPKPAVIQKAAA